MNHFTIPKELAHLKLDDRGYPIPFFAPIVDGKPNFRFLDPRKQLSCMMGQTCPICGKRLFKDYSYIIVGPVGLKNRISSDPAMHRYCAEFSMKACPHLYFHKAQRKEDAIAPFLIKEKPAQLFLVKCSKYQVVPDGLGHFLIRVTVHSSEEYIYQNNELIKK